MKISALLKRYGALILMVSGAVLYWVSLCLLEEKSRRYICLQTDQIELTHKIREVQRQKIETQKIEKQFQKAQKADFLKTVTVENLKKVLDKLIQKNSVRSLIYEVKSPQKKQIQKTLTFWYKVILDMEHPQDQEIFKFIEQLPYHLPGLIIPEQILLTRVDEMPVKTSQNSLVSGKYQFYVVTFETIPDVSP